MIVILFQRVSIFSPSKKTFQNDIHYSVGLKTLGNNTGCMSVGIPVRRGSIMLALHFEEVYHTTYYKMRHECNQFNNNLDFSCKFSFVGEIRDDHFPVVSSQPPLVKLDTQLP